VGTVASNSTKTWTTSIVGPTIIHNVDESAKVVTRGVLVGAVGLLLLAGSLLALHFPVYIPDFDKWGAHVKCGNGYHSDLLQATVDDNGGLDPQSAPGGASAAVRPPSNYVDQCKSALAQRRAWLMPLAAVGALILILELVVWARAASPKPTASAANPTDTDMARPSATVLDRRHRSRWTRSSNTTL
jgi:hypothetical protein